MTELHPEIKKVLERIIDRSQDTRKKYLDSINDMEIVVKLIEIQFPAQTWHM